VTGDGAATGWHGRYLQDDFGAFVRTTDGALVPNPDYKPDRDYVPRAERPEWAAIGLVGKLRLRKGQPAGQRWRKMVDISDAVELWLVR
jgi:hypothetical protein